MTFQIVQQNQSGDLVTTSLAIADGTEYDHASVIRLVRTYQADLEEFGLLDFKSESTGGRPTEYALLNEQQSTLIITYMRNNEIVRRFKMALVRAFYEIKQASIPKTFAEALRLAADQQEQIAVLAIERDHAIATKAHIGSKREVTAMVTASKAVREAAKLRDELGFSSRHATVLQVEDAMSQDFDWVPLRRWCKANEIVPKVVPDKRYPNGVKAWPAAAWLDVYGVHLNGLFPRTEGA